MHVRRPLFALGIFFFGVALVFLTGGVSLGEINYFTSGFGFSSFSYSTIPALVSFLLAGILLAKSFTD